MTLPKVAPMLNRTYSLPVVAAVLTVLNALLFHRPFLGYITNNVQCNANGVLIFVSWLLILLAINYFAFYITLFLGRKVGKALIAVTFVINAGCLYFINTYDTLLDDTMMGNVFNTQYAEAASYASWMGLIYLLLLGVIPSLLLAWIKLRYGSWRQLGISTAASIGGILLIAFANMSNWTWVDNHSTVMGSLLLPWSYIINSVRYQIHEYDAHRQEIPLPDAQCLDNGKRAAVLIIGESARRDHFSLYGYERNTNPLLSQTAGITAYPALSAATYTTAGVKAILDSQESDQLYEILPNYLYRAGVDVTWRTSNWGESPLHIAHIQQADELRAAMGDECPYDEILTRGIDSLIAQSTSDKVLIVLHTSTSHGPSYYSKYPSRFEAFRPVCQSVEMGECDHEHLINAYDNTILYTDYLIHQVIVQLQQLHGWTSTVFFVSDHGESLGEDNLYMHGVPRSIAPQEQYEIPFVVWVSDPTIRTKPIETIGQHHVFHSLLHFLGVQSPVYRSDRDLFE